VFKNYMDEPYVQNNHEMEIEVLTSSASGL
jgi:hypothetical protein